MCAGSPTAATWSSSQWRPDDEFETDNAPASRPAPARSWRGPKSAGSTIATNGTPPESGSASLCPGRELDVEVCPTSSVHGISRTEFDRLRLATAHSGVERRCLGELIELENRLSRGYVNGQRGGGMNRNDEAANLELSRAAQPL